MVNHGQRLALIFRIKWAFLSAVMKLDKTSLIWFSLSDWLGNVWEAKWPLSRASRSIFWPHRCASSSIPTTWGRFGLALLQQATTLLLTCLTSFNWFSHHYSTVVSCCAAATTRDAQEPWGPKELPLLLSGVWPSGVHALKPFPLFLMTRNIFIVKNIITRLQNLKHNA